MSGTSIDGIDAAFIETDGHDYVRPIAFRPAPYTQSFRHRLRRIFGRHSTRHDLEIMAIEQELTELHGELVNDFCAKLNDAGEKVDFIGFHGQTIFHDPKNQTTIQIGDGALLAKITDLPVINDFRTADVKAGGHGAPLVPLYHRALAAKLPKPVAILNIGGVANITWIGGTKDDDLLAFDVGPGNAMIDDWTLKTTGQPFDEYGLLASSGRVDSEIVDAFMAQPFFAKTPPKSLDRDTFSSPISPTTKAAHGAATLTMISARAVAESIKFLPARPKAIYVAGGGRLNNTLMRWIGDLTGISVNSVDDLGWSGDGLEAEAFAYLAVRSHLGLPLSVPGTTGVPAPKTGGRLYRP